MHQQTATHLNTLSINKENKIYSNALSLSCYPNPENV